MPNRARYRTRVTAFVAVIVAAVAAIVGMATTASASPLSRPEIRVRAFNPAAETRVPITCMSFPRSHRGPPDLQVGIVVGACVAPKALPGLPSSSLPTPAQAADLVRGANPVGSALKSDVWHRSASFAVDDIASNGSVYRIVGGDGVQRTLVQSPGVLNDLAGRFEWIVDDAGNLTHQMFVKGGSINGVPIKP